MTLAIWIKLIYRVSGGTGEAAHLERALTKILAKGGYDPDIYSNPGQSSVKPQNQSHFCEALAIHYKSLEMLAFDADYDADWDAEGNTKPPVEEIQKVRSSTLPARDSSQSYISEPAADYMILWRPWKSVLQTVMI